jgi:hypothetical protein
MDRVVTEFGRDGAVLHINDLCFSFERLAPIALLIHESCRGCGELRKLNDVFDGTLCARCREVRGLTRPEESFEPSYQVIELCSSGSGYSPVAPAREWLAWRETPVPA